MFQIKKDQVAVTIKSISHGGQGKLNEHKNEKRKNTGHTHFEFNAGKNVPDQGI